MRSHLRPRLKAAALAGAGAAIASFSAPSPYSPVALAALDPSRLAASACGSREQARGGAWLVAAVWATPATDAARPMPLFADLATSSFPVTTRSAQARRFFSQGLLLSYGFNHHGAVRSFRAAQRLDPDCAACWWGEAVALGPNINAPMDDRDRGAAIAALDRALALRPRASAMEAALIDAAAQRYARQPDADRAALDAGYADAMAAVAQRFPDNDDVAVLAAEAVMDASPWNYWEADKRTPNPRGREALRLIEGVLRRNSAHVQANHLYIHLMEASDPRAAESAADRLAAASPRSAAHLGHMPGHIYQLRGRHADAIRVNMAAARADEAYLRAAGDHGLVRYGYYPHNIHFIVTSAQMAGDMRTAMREARRLRATLDPQTSARVAWIQAIDAAPFFALAQFADPRAILAAPAPDARLAYAQAMRHFARAVAYAQRRDRSGFERELSALAQIRNGAGLKAMIDQGVPADRLTMLAELVARGRLAMSEGQSEQAIDVYRQAIAIEDGLPYQEPSYWYYPVRQSLGAALFKAGRHAEASQAFRAALIQTPNNGWALYGLAQSEAAQGHRLEAAAAERALTRAWLGDRRWLRMDRL